MTLQYGLTIENQNLINTKAKTKKDGVYTFRGVAYRVRANKVTHFAVRGEVLQQYGAFNVKLGTYKSGFSGEGVKFLKSIKE